MSNPGNLLIYTSGTRYVLLFKVVPEAKHDDVVEIVGAPRAGAKAMKLDQDAYHIETVRVLVKPRNKRQPMKIFSIQGIVFDDRLAGDEISDFFSGSPFLSVIQICFFHSSSAVSASSASFCRRSFFFTRPGNSGKSP